MEAERSTEPTRESGTVYVMGRPAIGAPTRVRFTEQQYAALDRLAEQHQTSRAEIIRRAVLRVMFEQLPLWGEGDDDDGRRL